MNLPDSIIEVLPTIGRLVNLKLHQITNQFGKVLEELNIQFFCFHDLRNYATNMLHAIGVPDVYIMQKSGWLSDSTLKKIYRGVMNDHKEKFYKKCTNA